ncbi:hypothetical protein Tco_0417331 [Tanacetum coccineum]
MWDHNKHNLYLAIGGVGIVSAYFSYTPEIAASFGVGLVGSIVYMRMLGNSMDGMAGGARVRKSGQFRALGDGSNRVAWIIDAIKRILYAAEEDPSIVEEAQAMLLNQEKQLNSISEDVKEYTTQKRKSFIKRDVDLAASATLSVSLKILSRT